MEPRYIIREISGYGINPGRHSSGGNRPPHTDVMIVDRAYCHRVIAYFGSTGNGWPRLEARRKLAEHRAALLNTEDE